MKFKRRFNGFIRRIEPVLIITFAMFMTNCLLFLIILLVISDDRQGIDPRHYSDFQNSIIFETTHNLNKRDEIEKREKELIQRITDFNTLINMSPGFEYQKETMTDYTKCIAGK